LEGADTAALVGVYWHEAEVITPAGKPLTVATGRFTISFQRVV
jgi:hypothetical protein